MNSKETAESLHHEFRIVQGFDVSVGIAESAFVIYVHRRADLKRVREAINGKLNLRVVYAGQIKPMQKGKAGP